MPILSLFLCLLLSFKSYAGSWKSLKEGDQTAQELLHSMEEKKSEGGNHPFYDGKVPQEAQFKSGDLASKSQNITDRDPASQMVYESADVRSQFKIDPTTDPLLLGSHKLMKNPLPLIGGEGTHLAETVQGGKDETLTCEESGEDSLETCTSDLHIKVVKTKIGKEWEGQFHFWKERRSKKKGHTLACKPLREGVFSAKRRQSGDITSKFKACVEEMGSSLSKNYVRLPSLPFKVSQIKEVTLKKRPQGQTGRAKLRSPHYLTSCRIDSNDHGTKYTCQPLITIVYEEDSYEVLPGEWVSTCDRLEEKADQGLCSYTSRTCTQGKGTRLIEGVPITQDCWQEAFTYRCEYPSKDDCGPLRARRCVQVDSCCKQMIGKTCVVYNQTYQCKGKASKTYTITGGSTPFCLDGNCRDQSYESNDEMMSSLAQLTLLKEMQGQIKNGLIFKGQDDRCSKYVLSFKDCCGAGKGWGKDVGLSSCKAKEKGLSKKRKAGLCHRIGTYCAKKILGKCIQKKTTYCCFNNKLLKAFHEQGRPQIKLGWGKPDKPLCRGFTIAEIQRIDFSKLDLREVYEDLMQKFNPQKQEGTEQKIRDRIQTIQKGLNPARSAPSSKSQPKQRSSA
jgi:type-F conjugative transfer system mating-pair stabilization protein TraN